MQPLVRAAEESRDWADIPGVWVIGGVIGVVLLWYAIRRLFR